MSLIHSALMGAVAGARSMTPLAMVANAARNGELPADNGAPALLATPLASAGALAIAVGELAGDKMKTAPDRIVLAGMAARIATGAIAGAALAPRAQRPAAVAIGVGVAVVSAYVTFELRMKALRCYGQTATGVVEDALCLGSAALIVRSAGSA